MKVRSLIIATFASLPLMAFATDDWAQLSKYDESNRKIIETHHYPIVVFLGNSITEGWPDFHPQFFDMYNFAGRGISGQTTYQYLVRFREDVIELQPKIVVINGGTNDIAENNYAYDEDRTFGNIVTMAELADASGIKVILTPILPADQFPWRKEIKDIPQKQRNINARIKEYAESNGYGYADYYTPMVTPSGSLNPDLTYDGVHPNANGYNVMEQIILPEIFKALPKGN